MRRLPWYALGAAALAAAATHRLVPVVTRLAMARRIPDRPGHYPPGASHRASVHGILDSTLPTRAAHRGTGLRAPSGRWLEPNASEADS